MVSLIHAVASIPILPWDRCVALSRVGGCWSSVTGMCGNMEMTINMEF